jgi:methionyl-tRNA formyltransferase
MVEAVDLVAAGKAPRVPQDESRATYDPHCTDEHAAVRWDRPLAEVYDLVRGCDPHAGAYARWQGEIVRLFDARPVREGVGAGGSPGRVLAIDASGLLVAAGSSDDVGRSPLRSPACRRRKGKAAEIARALSLAVGSVLSPGSA